MSRSKERRAQLATAVIEILATGASVASVVEMFTAILHANGFTTEPNPIAIAADSIRLDTATDTALIAAWFDTQAAKERELLDSGRCTNLVTTQERWLVYKAAAMEVRAGAWRTP